jgi:hypothetical protein
MLCGAWAQAPQNKTTPSGATSPNQTKASNSGASKSVQAKSDTSKKIPGKPISELPIQDPELQIAERVHVGQLPCELGASIHLTADAHSPGYFNLQGKGFKYRMRPVSTSTGAIRLEDEKAGAVWLQLANKSMLMDQKNGRRLADECAHPDQVAVANDMKINPPPALIDVSNIVTGYKR